MPKGLDNLGQDFRSVPFSPPAAAENDLIVRPSAVPNNRGSPARSCYRKVHNSVYPPVHRVDTAAAHNGSDSRGDICNPAPFSRCFRRRNARFADISGRNSGSISSRVVPSVKVLLV